MFDLETIIAMNNPAQRYPHLCQAKHGKCVRCNRVMGETVTAQPKPYPVSVGRNDCTRKVFHFSTIADAEEAIALLENGIPWDVTTGGYYIDAPENMVNPS